MMFDRRSLGAAHPCAAAPRPLFEGAPVFFYSHTPNGTTPMSRPLMYRLIDKTGIPLEREAVPCDRNEHMEAFAERGRAIEAGQGDPFRVARTELCNGEVVVSTVFLGIDHAFTLEPDTVGVPPLLFETMVFGGSFDELQHRTSTWCQALDEHHRVCGQILHSQPQTPGECND